MNEAIIWDDIIHTKRDAVIRLKNQKSEYLFTDISDTFSYVFLFFSLSSNFTLGIQSHESHIWNE